MRFDTLPTGMKNNKNTVTVVESVPNDGACCVNSTSKPEEMPAKGTISESGCTVNSTSKCYSLMVPSGVEGILMTGNGLIVTNEDISSEEYNQLFRTVLSLHKSSCWLLGTFFCWVTVNGATSTLRASTKRLCRLPGCHAAASAISCVLASCSR